MARVRKESGDGAAGAPVESTVLGDGDPPRDEAAGPPQPAARVEAAPPVSELVAPGQTLGPYRVVRRLGRGAMGVVYEAEDARLHRRVAVKVLPPSRTGDDERRRRFLREARAAAAVVHPNVAAVYGVGQSGALTYLVMELCAGETLRDAMKRRAAPFEGEEAVRIVEAIARGVAEAHELGIVHRDLKPENVMISADGAVKVLDFGLAKLLSPVPVAPDATARSTHWLTVDGRILGTPAYMSPEQSKGLAVDERTDVFALGVMLYELLTAARPFRGATAIELFIAIDRDQPAPPAALAPEVPAALSDLVLRCLAKAPGGRFASCRELADALRDVGDAEQALSIRAVETTPAAPDAAAGSATELRLVSVVRVALAPLHEPSPGSAGAAPSEERAAVCEVLAQHGAPAVTLPDGALVATFLQGPKGAGFATDLALQAARCAIAVRDAVSGAAIVVTTGRAVVRDGAPTGEAADRAAALAAEVGEDAILLDELSAGLLDGRCRARALGAGVFALERISPAADATRPLLGKPTPCVGRDAELAVLDVALGACVDDGSSRAVLVVAPPGQGKTRLLHEWLHRAEARTDPPLVLLGRGDPVRGAAGGLLAQALRPVLGVSGGDGAATAEVRAAVLAAVRTHVPGDEALHVAEMLGELCGVPFPDEGRVLLRAARADPPAMAEQVEIAWRTWLGAACAARPIVIVLEDLQWGDARTVSLVEAALRDLRESPFLVLALARPEIDERFPGLWGGRPQRLPLGPLGKRAGERLVREVLGQDADSALVGRIVHQSEGNALFLEELVRASAEGRGGQAPGTLLAMLQARIERLDPEERRVLRVASVLGERFRETDVRALLGGDEGEAGALLRGLAQREVLAAQREGAAALHRFRHALVREAAYGTLPEAERRTLHRAAAEHLAGAGGEPEVVAEHFERAGELERAADFYRAAAARADERFENRECMQWAQRGLACGPRGETRGLLLALDTSARAALNLWDGVLERALEGIPLVPRGSWASCILIAVTHGSALARAASERGGAPDLLGDLLQIEPLPEARRVYTHMLASLTWMVCVTERRSKLLPMFTRLRAECDRLAASDPMERRWSLWAESTALSLYEPAPLRALRMAEDALDTARLVGDRHVEHWLLVGDHELQWWQLGDAGAEARLREHQQAAAHRNLFVLQAAAALQLGRIACDTGDPAALAEAARAMWLLAEAPGASVVPIGQAYEILARIELHHRRPAVELARRGQELLSFVGSFSVRPIAVLVRALVAEGRADEACDLARSGLATIADNGGAGYLEVEMRLSASEAFSAARDAGRARAELAETLRQIEIRARSIDDPGWRRGYLTRNRVNVQARELARAWGVDDPTAVLVEALGASAGTV